MFPKIIDAHVHQFRRIQSAPSRLRVLRRMGRCAVELIVFNILGLPDIITDTVSVKWMPRDRRRQVVKNPSSFIRIFPDHGFFRRTAVHPTVPGRCSVSIRSFSAQAAPCAGRAQQVVPAAMARSAVLPLLRYTFLPQSRQGVVLRQKTNNLVLRRLPSTRPEMRSQIPPAPGNLKPFFLQKVRQRPRMTCILFSDSSGCRKI